MGKIKPLGYIFLDQNRLHVNRSIPGAYHAYMIRTPFANEGFDLEVPDLPEGYHLITKQDLDYDAVIFPFGDKLPIFAPDEPDYPGQCVACLVGPEQETTLELLSQINVVPTSNFSMRPQTRKLYKSATLTFGDPTEFMATSKHKVESQLHIAPHPLFDLEDRDIFAQYDEDSLRLELSHPWIHLIKTCVSEATGIPPKQIHVRGGVSYQLRQQRLVSLLIPSCIAGIATKLLKVPIHLHVSSNELMRYGYANIESKFRILSGHDDEGQIQAMRASVEVDAGAYPLASEEIIKQTVASFLGTYNIPNIDLKVQIYASNHTPRTYQGGFGEAASQLALEHHWDQASRQTPDNPLSFRLSHLRQSNAGPGKIVFDDSVPQLQKVLSKNAQFCEFNRRHASNQMVNRHMGFANGKRKGIGISLGYQPGNLIHVEKNIRPRVSMKLSEDGELEIFAPLEPGNMSVRDGWNTIISDYLSIEERNISYPPLTTQDFMDPGPLILGRQYSIVSALVAETAKKIKDRPTDASLPYEVETEIAGSERPFFNPQGFEGRPFVKRTWGSAACELVVCLDRGVIEIKKIWVTVYVGTIFKESRVRSILESSVRDVARLCLGWYSHSQNPVLKVGLGTSHSQSEETQINLSLLQSEDHVEDSIDSMSIIHGIESIALVLIPPAFLNALQQASGKSITTFPPSIENFFEEASLAT